MQRSAYSQVVYSRRDAKRKQKCCVEVTMQVESVNTGSNLLVWPCLNCGIPHDEVKCISLVDERWMKGSQS